MKIIILGTAWPYRGGIKISHSGIVLQVMIVELYLVHYFFVHLVSAG